MIKIMIVALTSMLGVFFTQAHAGDPGATPGAQYQAYRVVLDSAKGYQSVLIEPGAPYFGFKMNNRLLNKIAFDCGESAGVDCTVTSVIRLQPSPTDSQLSQYPSLDPFSYLWSDSYIWSDSYLWSD